MTFTDTNPDIDTGNFTETSQIRMPKTKMPKIRTPKTEAGI